ncbi:hypothetical protein BKA61DRAFT_57047 [Leptodontidium sp. MPI-SDFR-AT-0119]|nr:hypothetical protein BKA61DRAFT_57047 [Leptodontidium sp. MPI-SDFR-AT-0119]
MAIDWHDYNISDGRLATVCMQYAGGRWKLFAQLQDMRKILVRGNPIPYYVLRMMGSGRALLVKSPISVLPNIAEIRAQIKEDMIRLAKWYKQPNDIIPNYEDSDFTGFDRTATGVENNEAVKSTQSLRKYLTGLKDRIEKDNQTQQPGPSQQKHEILSVQGLDHRRLVQTQRDFHLLNKHIFSHVLEECRTIDSTYLWQKKKKLDVVVEADAGLQGDVGETLGERFAKLEIKLEDTYNPARERGYREYESVRIPSFTLDMSSLTLKELLLSTHNQLDDSQTGALLRHIELKSEKEYRTDVWIRANSVVEGLLKEGASVKPVPQGILVCSVHDDAGGRWKGTVTCPAQSSLGVCATPSKSRKSVAS